MEVHRAHQEYRLKLTYSCARDKSFFIIVKFAFSGTEDAVKITGIHSFTMCRYNPLCYGSVHNSLVVHDGILAAPIDTVTAVEKNPDTLPVVSGLLDSKDLNECLKPTADKNKIDTSRRGIAEVIADLVASHGLDFYKFAQCLTTGLIVWNLNDCDITEDTKGDEKILRAVSFFENKNAVENMNAQLVLDDADKFSLRLSYFVDRHHEFVISFFFDFEAGTKQIRQIRYCIPSVRKDGVLNGPIPSRIGFVTQHDISLRTNIPAIEGFAGRWLRYEREWVVPTDNAEPKTDATVVLLTEEQMREAASVLVKEPLSVNYLSLWKKGLLPISIGYDIARYVDLVNKLLDQFITTDTIMPSTVVKELKEKMLQHYVNLYAIHRRKDWKDYSLQIERAATVEMARELLDKVLPEDVKSRLCGFYKSMPFNTFIAPTVDKKADADTRVMFDKMREFAKNHNIVIVTPKALDPKASVEGYQYGLDDNTQSLLDRLAAARAVDVSASYPQSYQGFNFSKEEVAKNIDQQLIDLMVHGSTEEDAKALLTIVRSKARKENPDQGNNYTFTLIPAIFLKDPK